MVRIARPESLAIWHRGRSHRPNRSGTPNRRHFASLDLKKHPDFLHRRPTSQDFRGFFSWHFPVIPDQANALSHRDAKKLFRIDLGVCDSNRIAHRGCIARFGPLRSLLRTPLPVDFATRLPFFFFPNNPWQAGQKLFVLFDSVTQPPCGLRTNRGAMHHQVRLKCCESGRLV